MLVYSPCGLEMLRRVASGLRQHGKQVEQAKIAGQVINFRCIRELVLPNIAVEMKQISLYELIDLCGF